jgi:hypothetical protein
MCGMYTNIIKYESVLLCICFINTFFNRNKTFETLLSEITFETKLYTSYGINIIYSCKPLNSPEIQYTNRTVLLYIPRRTLLRWKTIFNQLCMYTYMICGAIAYVATVDNIHHALERHNRNQVSS